MKRTRIRFLLVWASALAVGMGVGVGVAQTPPPGSTITQSVVFDSDLDLTGQNFTGTVYTIGADGIRIDGNGHRIIAPEANLALSLFGRVQVTVCNLTILGPRYGIKISGGGGNRIENCLLRAKETTNPYPEGTGVWIEGSSDNIVLGCDLAGYYRPEGGSGEGVLVTIPSGKTGPIPERNVIQSNKISGANSGISLCGATDTVVKGNTCPNLGRGIYLGLAGELGCSGTLVEGNDMTDCVFCVTVDHSTGTTIRNNKLKSLSCGYAWLIPTCSIYLGTSLATTNWASDGNFNGNDFTETEKILGLTNEDGLTLQNLDFRQFPGIITGITLSNCTNMTLRNLQIPVKYWGVLLSGGSHNRVENCQMPCYESVTWRAGLSLGGGFGVASNSNTVTGCTFTGYSATCAAGIEVVKGSGNTIDNNDCSQSDFGIILSKATKTQIINNKCRDCVYGVSFGHPGGGYAGDCMETLIDSNDLTNSYTGICVQQSTSTTIRNNILKTRWRGHHYASIYLRKSLATTDWASDGNFNGNDFNGTASFMLILAGEQGLTLEELDFSRFTNVGKGIRLSDCTGMTLRRMKFLGLNEGIYITGGGSNRVEQCSIGPLQDKGAVGLLVSSSNDNVIQGCTCSGWNYGLHVSGSASRGNVIKDNNCSGSNYGILLDGVLETTIQGNHFSNCPQGIYVATSGETVDTVIDGNDLTGCTTCITLYKATNTTIRNNTLQAIATGTSIYLPGACLATTDWAGDGNFNGNDFQGTGLVLQTVGDQGVTLENMDFSRFAGIGSLFQFKNCTDMALRNITARPSKNGITISKGGRYEIFGCDLWVGPNNGSSLYASLPHTAEVDLRIARCVLGGGRYGLYLSSQDGACVEALNTTIYGAQYGVLCSDNVQLHLRNSIVWGNTDDIYGNPQASVTYSDIGERLGGAVWPGIGNISADPLFVNRSAGDFHLLPNSPCIDTGDPQDIAPPPGAGTRIDMGAFESIGNHPPTVEAGGPYSVEEGSSVSLQATGSDPDGDPLTYTWDLDHNGTYETPGQTVTFSAANLDGPSPRMVAVRATDPDGLSTTDEATVEVANVAPTISSLTAPVAPLVLGTAVSVGALFSDPCPADTHTAAWDWGNGTTSEGTVEQAAGAVSGTYTYPAPGIYSLQLTLTDDDGGTDTEEFRYVVVYDPNGGFVTGGGWILPGGAKANFGFIVKYKDGQPTGQLQYDDHGAGLTVHVSQWDWLVIFPDGVSASMLGRGAVNGEAGYAVWVELMDSGEPGKGYDWFAVTITREPGYSYHAEGLLDGGNVQLHTNGSRLAGPPAGEWLVRLQAQAGAATDRLNYLGAAPEKPETALLAAVPAAPRSGATVDLYFPQPSRAAGAGRYATDLQPAGAGRKVWEFVVETAQAGTEVMLTWPDLTGVPAGVGLTLADEETGQRVSLRSRAHYVYRAGATPRRFQIAAEPQVRTGVAITQLQVQPTRGGLTLTYQVTQEAVVAGEMRTLSGRPIAPLAVTRAAAGLNTLACPSQDEQGRPLPNGVYLVYLTATTEDGQTVQAVRQVVIRR